MVIEVRTGSNPVIPIIHTSYRGVVGELFVEETHRKKLLKLQDVLEEISGNWYALEGTENGEFEGRILTKDPQRAPKETQFLEEQGSAPPFGISDQNIPPTKSSELTRINGRLS